MHGKSVLRSSSPADVLLKKHKNISFGQTDFVSTEVKLNEVHDKHLRKLLQFFLDWYEDCNSAFILQQLVACYYVKVVLLRHSYDDDTMVFIEYDDNNNTNWKVEKTAIINCMANLSRYLFSNISKVTQGTNILSCDERVYCERKQVKLSDKKESPDEHNCLLKLPVNLKCSDKSDVLNKSSVLFGPVNFYVNPYIFSRLGDMNSLYVNTFVTSVVYRENINLGLISNHILFVFCEGLVRLPFEEIFKSKKSIIYGDVFRLLSNCTRDSVDVENLKELLTRIGTTIFIACNDAYFYKILEKLLDTDTRTVDQINSNYMQLWEEQIIQLDLINLNAFLLFVQESKKAKKSLKDNKLHGGSKAKIILKLIREQSKHLTVNTTHGNSSSMLDLQLTLKDFCSTAETTPTALVQSQITDFYNFDIKAVDCDTKN